jgi:DNA-binding transcriptional MerR regulator
MTMRASEIAKLSEVSKDTLRYYERIGLITSPKRSINGHGHYSQEHLEELLFIKKAKAVGFSLNQIKVTINDAILTNDVSSVTPDCYMLQKAIREQIVFIDEKIKELNQAKRALQNRLL